MQIVVLGSAAGGGFPQWNCACVNCRRARSGDPAAEPRTQSSLAVSADGRTWVLLNASPDLRQQCLATPALHPHGVARGSPIAAVVLTNGDVDHVGGLLALREAQPFALYAAREVLAVLDANPMFNVLDRAIVDRRPLALDEPTPIAAQNGAPLRLSASAFTVPGKVPLHLEDRVTSLATENGNTIGLEVIADDGGRFFYVPGCAAMSNRLASRLHGAALVFFDGTLWEEREMISAGLGKKTGSRMGHMSMSGAAGTITAFAGLDVRRKIFIHINNTNPVLLAGSPQRAATQEAGWEIACDGMEIRL